MIDIITNRFKEKIDYTFEPGIAETKINDWIIILGHGVTGNKERPLITDTARALNAAGYDTLRFSFAGNGDSEGDFRAATISTELGDLASVLDAVTQHYDRICYIGHSMGGAVGVIQASLDSRISCLVSLAGMINTRTFAETEFGAETPDAGLMWDEETCPLSSDFMKDLCETIQSVLPQAEAVKIPWLLLHGTADDVVSPDDTKQVQSLKGDAVTVVLVDGAGHSFGEPGHLRQVTDSVVSWLGAQN
jgi:alpha/beta superfamily hydrolase